jgi:hypothetical protein
MALTYNKPLSPLYSDQVLTIGILLSSWFNAHNYWVLGFSRVFGGRDMFGFAPCMLKEMAKHFGRSFLHVT